MSGTLYLVATPIGNLGDFSPRAAETLGAVDFIAAEDTRVSVKLLNHFQIKKPLVSYHEHNHAAAGQAILQRLLAGESCALVTDAGTPAISDPGEDLVRLCAENGVEELSIPGCCAAVNALAVSGLPTGRFTFEGFLTVNKKSRRERLDSLKNEERTMIFHEAPTSCAPRWRTWRETFGPDRRVALCRELTKLHEETVRTTLGEAAAYYQENTPKGEYVLVVAAARPGRPPPSRWRREQSKSCGWCPGIRPEEPPGRYRPTRVFPKTSCTPRPWSGHDPRRTCSAETPHAENSAWASCFQRTGRSQLFQFFQALGADILPLEYRDVFGGVAENAAGLVFFQNDGRAFHIDFQCILLADIQRPAHLDREHDPSQFIHLSDNSR